MTPFSIPVLLLIGLLMTIPNPLLDAAESDTSNELLLTDFTSSSADLGWYVMNDNVMGGRSKGTFEQVAGELTFIGRTNTNGGGFSSIRTRSSQLDVSNHDGIRLRVKGDGRRYTWQFATPRAGGASKSVTGQTSKHATVNGAQSTSPSRISFRSFAAINWMGRDSTPA